MLPKLLIIAFIFDVNNILAQQDSIKNVVNNSVIENPLTFKYDYTITGKNNSYEQRSEYGNEKESKGNYFIQLPEDDSKYEVHYTANNWGFHPVVRLPTKNNHSEITSHLQQNENIIKSLNKNNNNKSDEIYNESNSTSPIKQNYIQYDDTAFEEQQNLNENKNQDTPISLNNIFSNMFSNGIVNFLSTKSIATPINDNNDDEIPSESLDDVIDNSNIINLAENQVKFNDLSSSSNIQRITDKTTIIFNDKNNFENTTSLNIFVTERDKNSELPFIISPLPITSTNLPINNSSFVEKDIAKNQSKNKENLISDNDVLEINDAIEENRNLNNDNNNDVVVVPSIPVLNKLKLIKDQILSYVFPQNDTNSFNLPIIVDENSSDKNHEDNLIAEESQKRHHVGKYLLPPQLHPTEVKILPSREQFINIPRTKTEKQVNVQIVQENLKQLPSSGKYINGKKLFTPAYELDSYHENAEKTFSIDDNDDNNNNNNNKYTTEAQSRKFLKNFHLKLSPSGMIKERIYSTTKSTTTTATTLNPIKSTVSTLRYSVTPPTPTKMNGNLKITTSIPKNLLPPNRENLNNNKINVNFDTTTPIPIKKSRGKTFVEIQKSINVHNLLIKEDKNGRFIEQHEEYIKPIPKHIFKEFKYQQNNQNSYQYSPPINQILNNNNNNHNHQSTVTPVTPPKTLTIPYPENDQYFRIIPKPSTEKIVAEKIIHLEKEIPVPYPVEKFVEIPVEKVVEKIIPVEKSVPYPIEKYIDRPIHVTKYIDRPYPVERITEKLVPYPVKEIIEKPINRPYPVDRPYPVTVEKIVEKEIPVEHIVEKYIDRPIPYPIEFKQYIPQPYPVEKIVEKYIDRPVEVKKIVEKNIPVPVEVEKVVEKFIDRNVTIEKIIDRPVEVERIVEKIIDRPVPVAYPVHVPIHIPYHVPVPVPVPNKKIIYNRNNNHYLQPNKHLFTDIHQFPYLGSNSGNTIDFSRELFTLVQPTPPHISAVNFFNQPPTQQQQQFLSTLHSQTINRPFYKFPGRYISDNHQQISQPSISLSSSLTGPLSSESQYIPIKYAKNFGYKTFYHGQNNNNNNNDYFGPVPLENDYSQWQKYYSNLDGIVSTLHKRSSDFGRNLRVEYGFKPPLIPSIETDDQGVPIEKKD